MEVIANNIANANTPGYSRQSAQLATLGSMYTGAGYLGRGVTVATLVEITRLGHAWSGGAARLPFGDDLGPDASRMVWAFASRQFGT